MSRQITISDESYKKFQAALMLTGEDEDIVISSLINQYAHKVFEGVMGKKENDHSMLNVQTNNSQFKNEEITQEKQKRLFTNWFRSLTRNGKPYNPVTISGYTGRIENACKDPTFNAVPVTNLFSITDLSEFKNIQNQIKNCVGYAEFDAKSHNGFTAALRKYEEFLRFQLSNTPIQSDYITQPYTRSSNIHRWTVEEDEICCKRFLEYYVVNKSDIDTVQFLQMLAREVPDVSEGSLRMKIQNIKYLTMQAGIKDTSSIKWLSQYSMQCERAFKKSLEELELL